MPPIPNRDQVIAQRYKDGASLQELIYEFNLSRQRLHVILRAQGVPKRPRSFSYVGRDEFLGANISKRTKSAVQQLAKKRGVSISELTDVALKEYTEAHNE